MINYIKELKKIISDKYIIKSSFDDVIHSKKNNFKFKNKIWDHYEIETVQAELMLILLVALDSYGLAIEDCRDTLKKINNTKSIFNKNKRKNNVKKK